MYKRIVSTYFFLESQVLLLFSSFFTISNTTTLISEPSLTGSNHATIGTQLDFVIILLNICNAIAPPLLPPPPSPVSLTPPPPSPPLVSHGSIVFLSYFGFARSVALKPPPLTLVGSFCHKMIVDDLIARQIHVSHQEALHYSSTSFDRDAAHIFQLYVAEIRLACGILEKMEGSHVKKKVTSTYFLSESPVPLSFSSFFLTLSNATALISEPSFTSSGRATIGTHLGSGITLLDICNTVAPPLSSPPLPSTFPTPPPSSPPLVSHGSIVFLSYSGFARSVAPRHPPLTLAGSFDCKIIVDDLIARQICISHQEALHCSSTSFDCDAAHAF